MAGLVLTFSLHLWSSGQITAIAASSSQAATGSASAFRARCSIASHVPFRTQRCGAAT
jgi:hypothetical protein